MILTAITLVLGQGLIVGALVYFVRSFGAWTQALLRTHESNMRMHQHTLQVLDEIRRRHSQPQFPPDHRSEEVA